MQVSTTFLVVKAWETTWTTFHSKLSEGIDLMDDLQLVHETAIWGWTKVWRFLIANSRICHPVKAHIHRQYLTATNSGITWTTRLEMLMDLRQATYWVAATTEVTFVHILVTKGHSPNKSEQCQSSKKRWFTMNGVLSFVTKMKCNEAKWRKKLISCATDKSSTKLNLTCKCNKHKCVRMVVVRPTECERTCYLLRKGSETKMRIIKSKLTWWTRIISTSEMLSRVYNSCDLSSCRRRTSKIWSKVFTIRN